MITVRMQERIYTALIKDRENGGNRDLSSINVQNEISEEDFKLNSIGNEIFRKHLKN